MNTNYKGLTWASGPASPFIKEGLEILRWEVTSSCPRVSEGWERLDVLF